MKIRMIDGISLQILEDKNYVYEYLIKYYDMIYKEFDYGCFSVINECIELDTGYLVTIAHLYDCLRYKTDVVFVDMKTREVMTRI